MVWQGQLAGSISLHHIQVFDHIAELGYWIAPGARGKGLATHYLATELPSATVSLSQTFSRSSSLTVSVLRTQSTSLTAKASASVSAAPRTFACI